MKSPLATYRQCVLARNCLVAAIATTVAVGAIMALGGCALPVAPATPSAEQKTFRKVLVQLGSTAIPMLQAQANTAMAETPPNTHIAQCAGTLPDPTNPQTGTGADDGVCWAVKQYPGVATLVFRGSMTKEDWFRDALAEPAPAVFPRSTLNPPNPAVPPEAVRLSSLIGVNP